MLTVANLFDRDPPFARDDYDHEPFIGNPLGRGAVGSAATQGMALATGR